MEPHNSIFAKIRGARFAPPMGAMTLIWTMTMSNLRVLHPKMFVMAELVDVDPESNTTTQFIMPVLEK